VIKLTLQARTASRLRYEFGLSAILDGLQQRG
jgi:hypothetical protein